MKLNPEELEIVTFPTDQADVMRPINSDYPTPQTYCFVCD